MIYRGCCVCRLSGIIIATYDWEGLASPESIIGKLTFDWFHPDDRDQVITMFARAAIWQPVPAAIVRFAPGVVHGDWACQARYIPTGEPAAPVLGVFSMFTSKVLSLTKRERFIAKLIPSFTSREIAGQLGMTPNAVTATKKRLASKLAVSQAELVPFLALLKSVLVPN